MKNKLLKAQMRGQWIDMQKTRGGVPARLWKACGNHIAYRNMLEKNGVPYVIGRTGWNYYGKPKPVEHIFIHYTDKTKDEKIWQFCTACSQYIFYAERNPVRAKSYAETALNIYRNNKAWILCTPKYAKCLANYVKSCC